MDRRRVDPRPKRKRRPARASSARPRRETTVDPEVLAELHVAAADPRRADRLAERLTSAAAALDRERFDDARRMVAPVVRELPRLAAGHEISGLANYRMGRWREAAAALEQARVLHTDPALLPVLADCYRALRRWTAVDAIWREIRELSPSHEVMAEARIVVAGCARRSRRPQAGDRPHAAGREAAQEGPRPPPSRSGTCSPTCTTAPATRWAPRAGSAQSPAHDADFVDARDRLRALGR